MPDEKMKYPLLEFEYDKKLYEELLTLNPHPEFMDRVSTVTEDYEHDDFGSIPGDEKNALGHAAGVLWKIQKNGLPVGYRVCQSWEEMLIWQSFYSRSQRYAIL